MKIIPLALFAVFFAPAAQAATLAELNGPLLNKGQWEVNALSSLNYSANHERKSTVGFPGGKSEYDATQVVLSPGLSYGLTDKLMLFARESYYIPYSSSYKHYVLPGGPDKYAKNNSLGGSSFSSILTWRPSEPWEFLLSGSGNYMGSEREAGALPGPTAVNTLAQQNHGTTLIAQATWLSRPKAGPMTANNRADLDGLINPLLDRGQAKAAFSLTYFRDFAHMNSNTPTTRRSDSTSASEAIALPAFTYGLPLDLQAQASASVGLPNATSSLARAHTVSGTNYSSDRTKSRTLAQYTPALTLTRRFGPQLQCYVSGSYNYRKTSQRGYSVNENTGAISPNGLVIGMESGTIGAGADWISAPRRDGRPLAADLDGLKRPLLEMGQFWAEATYSTSKQRSWIAGQPTQPGETSSVYYGKLTYGLRDALQTFASLQLTPGYSYRGSSSKDIYPAAKIYGAGLTWRPRQTFQASAETSYSPTVRKSEDYDAFGAVTSNSKSETDSFQLSLSATWLW